MDQEMANLKSHDVYELMPRMNGMRTLKLGRVLEGKFKNAFLRRIRVDSLLEVTTNVLVLAWLALGLARISHSLARFGHSPVHWETAKRVLRYLKLRSKSPRNRCLHGC